MGSMICTAAIAIGVAAWTRVGVHAWHGASASRSAAGSMAVTRMASPPRVQRRAGGSAAIRVDRARIESPAPVDDASWTPPRHAPAAERSFICPDAVITWRDPNAERIRSWRGDVRDCGTAGPELGVSIEIDSADVDEAVTGFGFHPDEISFRYRTQEEYDLGALQRDRLLDARGVRLNDEVVSPDYPWMLRRGVPTVHAMADRLEETARRAGATSIRGRASIMAGFVQALAYRENLEASDDPGLEQLGVMLPAGTLSRASGDCDSKAVLLCSLLASSQVCDSVLVHTDDHTLVGLGLKLRTGDDSVRAWRRDWVLLETTDRWPVGRVARRHVGERVTIEEPTSLVVRTKR
ncbi:MAG: hypothetical protein FJ254_04040 [Phycisphaerae bacterium]|nr:hypothetical protein [Phycisphaerae bacterium]